MKVPNKVLDCGFVMDKVATSICHLQRLQREGSVPPEVQKLVDNDEFMDWAKSYLLPGEFYDACAVFPTGALSVINGFTGEYTTAPGMVPNTEDDGIGGVYNNATLVYLQAEKPVKMFPWEAGETYTSAEELADEFRTRLASFGYTFPEDFNFNARICTIVGIC